MQHECIVSHCILKTQRKGKEMKSHEREGEGQKGRDQKR